MLTHPDQRLFWPDEDYDREHACDGLSRFGAYLHSRHAGLFRHGGELVTDRLRFAAAAWEIASAPIMAPPYVRSHPRVLFTVPEWDDEQRLAMAVGLAGPAPAGAGELRERWHGWSIQHDPDQWVAPFDCDRLVVLSRVEVRVPIGRRVAAAGLPLPRYADGAVVTAVAKEAVVALCGVLNGNLAGLLAAWGDQR